MRAGRGIPAALALAATLLAAPSAARPAPREHCIVCVVLSGEKMAETIAATSEHGGKTFHFCSAECKGRFDADPEAFVPVVPRPAPALNFDTTLEGKEFDPASLEGRVVLVDFWATWCAPCVAALPRLTRLHEENRKRNFEVFGVSIDHEKSAAELDRFLRQRKVTYRAALDGGDDPAWRRFHVPAVPSLFLIDETGQVVAQWVGAAVDHRAIERAVEDFLRDGADRPRAASR